MQDMVARGIRASEEEVLGVARQLLEVLQYLGGLRPAVTHRDVKPENIVVEGGRWGGEALLWGWWLVVVPAEGKGVCVSAVVGWGGVSGGLQGLQGLAEGGGLLWLERPRRAPLATPPARPCRTPYPAATQVAAHAGST
jgi:serine/threonine protein kinase